MFFVMNEDGLRQLDSFPCVVQQYIPHGSVLYKVCLKMRDSSVFMDGSIIIIRIQKMKELSIATNGALLHIVLDRRYSSSVRRTKRRSDPP